MLRRGRKTVRNVEARAEVKQVPTIAAAVADKCDPAAIKAAPLKDQDVGDILDWRDIADHSPVYKVCCVQWTSLALRDTILERLSVFTDGRSKVAEVVHSRCKLKDALGELHIEPSGGCLRANKTLYEVRKLYHSFKQETILRVTLELISVQLGKHQPGVEAVSISKTAEPVR
jgi:hypothetical protein